jgi:hypothetical protein
MNPLAYIRSAVGIATMLAIVSVSMWAWRVNSLRANWKNQTETITLAIGKAAGTEIRPRDAVVTVQRIATARDDARADLGQCRTNRQHLEGALTNQNAAIAALRADGERRAAELERVAIAARASGARAQSDAAAIMARRPGADACTSADTLILETVR